MTSSDAERFATYANNSARMSAHLLFASEVTQAIADHDAQKLRIDKDYADRLSNINGSVAVTVTAAIRRLNMSLETLSHTLDEDEEYDE